MSSDLRKLIDYGKQLNVLFIEDNDDVRDQLIKLLENFFANIEIAEDGIVALEKYNNFIKENNSFYDIIITDLSMPKMDGVELSKEIISINPYQVIVVISAHTESDKLLKLIDIGIYKFLQKPVNYKDLLLHFSSIISKIKREKSYFQLENRVKSIEIDNQKLNELVITDKLTSIYNRRFLDNFLIKKFKYMAKNDANDFTIIFVDIDNFKQINDKYGHLLGDRILIEFAQTLEKNIRANDIVGRWGGEEFIIILDRTTIDQSIVIAEKLRKIISEKIFERIGHLTASFGIADYKNKDTISSLIQRADYSLYKAKEEGRNKICFI